MDNGISERIFSETWAVLLSRFGRKPDNTAQAAYRAFLSKRMTEEEFKEGAAFVWASCEFFPRPVDFLRPKMLRLLDEVRHAASLDIRTGEAAKAMPPGGWVVVKAAGGLHMIQSGGDAFAIAALNRAAEVAMEVEAVQGGVFSPVVPGSRPLLKAHEGARAPLAITVTRVHQKRPQSAASILEGMGGLADG